MWNWTRNFQANALILNITEGSVEGIQKYTYTGEDYYAFYSIPYAQTPTGTLRFQVPKTIYGVVDVNDFIYIGTSSSWGLDWS